MKGSKSKIKHDEEDTSLLTAFQAVKLSNVISSLVCSITHACYQALSHYVSFSSPEPALLGWTCLSVHKGGARLSPSCPNTSSWGPCSSSAILCPLPSSLALVLVSKSLPSAKVAVQKKLGGGHGKLSKSSSKPQPALSIL